MTLSTALALAVKVLNKTMDVSKLSAEKGADFSSLMERRTDVKHFNGFDQYFSKLC